MAALVVTPARHAACNLEELYCAFVTNCCRKLFGMSLVCRASRPHLCGAMQPAAWTDGTTQVGTAEATWRLLGKGAGDEGHGPEAGRARHDDCAGPCRMRQGEPESGAAATACHGGDSPAARRLRLGRICRPCRGDPGRRIAPARIGHDRPGAVR